MADDPLLGVTPPFVPDPSFFGQVRRVASHAVYLTTGIDLIPKVPFVKPGPFAITFLGPQAIGGVVPNRAYGLSPDVSLLNVFGFPFSAEYRADIYAANRIDVKTHELQLQLREKELIPTLTDKQLLDRADVVRVNALRGFPNAVTALPLLEAEIQRRGITAERRAAQGNYVGAPPLLPAGLAVLAGRKIERTLAASASPSEATIIPAPVPILPPVIPPPTILPAQIPSALDSLPPAGGTAGPPYQSTAALFGSIEAERVPRPKDAPPVSILMQAAAALAPAYLRDLETERNDP